LEGGEEIAEDPAAFDRKAHPPKLIPVAKGEQFVALTRELDNGEVFVRAERDGATYACLLLADSFDLL
jgi:hypothetical protein